MRVISTHVVPVHGWFAEGLHDQRAVEIRRASVAELPTYLTNAQAQLAGGLGVGADVLRTRTRVAAEAANLADAEHALDAAQVELNDHMGRPPRQPFSLAPSGEHAPGGGIFRHRCPIFRAGRVITTRGCGDCVE